MATRKRVTIRQVARESGVSTQTVSRVINDRLDVAPQTRLRVQQVIENLGYRPNVLARSLIHRRSHSMGVVALASDYYGPSRTLVGIEHMIRNLGYSLLLDFLHHPETTEVAQIFNRLLSRQVDGIIWAIPEIGNNRAWLHTEKINLHVPVIFTNMEPQGHLPVVAIDNHLGGCLATKHLLAQGYQNIGIITGPLDWWESRQRLAGWQVTLQEVGKTVNAPQIIEGDWSAASGEAGFRHLLAKYPEVDAVFVCNDQMALGVLQAAHWLGMRVPEDLGVVGFDNIPESAYFWPALTTVEQPLLDLGSRAVLELSRLIEADQKDDSIIRSETILLQPELILRDSSLALHRRDG